MPKGFQKFAPPGRPSKVRKPAAKKVYTTSGKDLPIVSGSSSEYISSITALKRRESSDEALHLLQKIASMVTPIMRNHGLRVVTLCEFYPKDARLLGLNVNHGQKICIRLRPASNDKIFFPLTELLGTMLHELSHNIHGPHDDKFYSYMGKLRRELEDLMAQGFTGSGFFSSGNKLGSSAFGPNGRTLSGLPTGLNGLVDPVKLAEAKKRALAAEKKAKPKQPGKRLGTLTNDSQSLSKNISIRELALRAAEQRIEDAKWCGKNPNATPEELGMDDDVIELKAPDFCKSFKPSSSAIQPQVYLKGLKDEEIKELDVIDLTED